MESRYGFTYARARSLAEIAAPAADGMKGPLIRTEKMEANSGGGTAPSEVRL